jgi:hypothetical protein
MVVFTLANSILCMATLSILNGPVNAASISSFVANNHLSEQNDGDVLETAGSIYPRNQYLRKLSKSKSSKSVKSMEVKSNKGKSSSKSRKSSKSTQFPTVSLDCYLLNEGLGEDQTAAPAAECSPLYDSMLSLQDGSFPREDFTEFFNQQLLPGLEDFIMKGNTSTGSSLTTDFDLARDRLEKFIFDGVPLDINDFSQLLAAFPPPASTSPDVKQVAVVSEKPEDIAAYKKDTKGRGRAMEQYSENEEAKAVATLPAPKNEVSRALIDDDDLSPECLDVIVRIVVEAIGIFLSVLGIRGIVLRPFKSYFVTIKGGQLNGLVLTAYRQSNGQFDASFFAGLVVSFLSILTWDDIKSSLSTLDSSDWLSLAIGFSLAVASVLATGGLAISFAITGMLIQADSLRGDIAELEKCFRLCSDGFTQSGGQQTTTYTVLLDRSRGKLNLYYEMYTIPDRLDLIYEGATIFTTGGLVSGSQTIQRDIDGDAKEILVRITAPNSGTAWNFSIDCPVPNIF